MDRHNIALFGQKTGLLFDSGLKTETNIFITMIKKKGEIWEKKDEGKTVSFSIGELVCIHDVLSKKRKVFNTVHAYKNNNTKIIFSWDEKNDDTLWVNIDDYSRPIGYPDYETFEKLIDHVLSEKIAFATGLQPKSEN